jgi:uncharacterized protein (DUF58 family)
MTARGWWCLFCVLLVLVVGLERGLPALSLVALTLLLWIGWEWLFFSLRVRTLLRKLDVERQVRDERGPVTTLWAGRDFTVRVALHLRGAGRLPYVTVTDPVPFGVVHDVGPTSVDGEVRTRAPLHIEYRVHCPLTGVARFEGLRVELADLHGFFAHVTFVRFPVVLRILPRSLVGKVGGGSTKRHNELPPPGVHRLRRPGSGSELLELRDYIPGDPPRTIAWKISAKRDRLITREFESEVPVRCTLFLDTSSSVRIPSPVDERGPRGKGEKPVAAAWKPLDQLVEVAAGVVRASLAGRDLAGLCLFDEQGAQLVRAERTRQHASRLMQLLGDAAALSPVAARADPEELAPIAYAFAQEVYPDLLRPEVNRMPAWLNWLVASPRYTRHRRGKLDTLYRGKGAILLGSHLLGLFLLVVNVAALAVDLPDWLRFVLAFMFFPGSFLVAAGAWALFLFGLLVSGRQRRLARMRKRLAALFAVRHGPTPGGLEVLVEDDDLYSLHLQRFLAEHQVPCAVPLYDPDGRYLFNRPEKLQVLARALTRAAGQGRDNELFVILADLLELEGHLEPLLQSVRVALARHHQVVVVCAWPRGVPLPGEDSPRVPRRHSLPGLVLELAWDRLHAAYAGLRRAFARMGVPVTCAGSDESVPLVVQRLQRLRSVGGRR